MRLRALIERGRAGGAQRGEARALVRGGGEAPAGSQERKRGRAAAAPPSRRTRSRPEQPRGPAGGPDQPPQPEPARDPRMWSKPAASTSAVLIADVAPSPSATEPIWSA